MGKKKHSKRMKRADVAMDANGMAAPSGLGALRANEQFLVGALVGAAAAYALGDEQLRGKLMRAGLRLYSNLAGGFEEMKEQLADISAEMAAQEAV